jgi:hypothetical protein
MPALFCLRLACGLIGSLLVLQPASINPRFYRTHFLTGLGLCVGAAFFLWGTAGVWLLIVVGAAAVAALVGSLAWSFEGAPGGRMLIVVTVLLLAGGLGLAEFAQSPGPATDGRDTATLAPVWLFLGDLTSAALLGAATTAMLLGHNYLIAPNMSIAPLLRVLGLLLAATVLRLAVASIGLWFWTATHSLTNLEDETVLWLPVRWGIGLLGPIVLGIMAWQTAKIRSTQSATGMLYVVVILCFLGELTSQLLLGNTGYLL